MSSRRNAGHLHCHPGHLASRAKEVRSIGKRLDVSFNLTRFTGGRFRHQCIFICSNTYTVARANFPRKPYVYMTCSGF